MPSYATSDPKFNSLAVESHSTWLIPVSFSQFQTPQAPNTHALPDTHTILPAAATMAIRAQATLTLQLHIIYSRDTSVLENMVQSWAPFGFSHSLGGRTKGQGCYYDKYEVITHPRPSTYYTRQGAVNVVIGDWYRSFFVVGLRERREMLPESPFSLMA